MSYDLSKPLVIGISSRALFNLEQENKIFEEQGVEAYEAYQVAHENEILQKGAAFQLIKAFLELKIRRHVFALFRDIMITSTSLPSSVLFNSKNALTSGAEIAPYLKAFKTDLFLSANSVDVQSAINDGIAAGRILTGDAHADPKQKINQIRIAFDGDAVLFSAESEKIFQKNGIQAFEEHEKANANTPMAKGPFANFLTKLSYVQQMFKEKEIQPIRTALVTSRNAPAHERAVKTLRNWGVSINEAFFLGGVSKTEVLTAFGAHIFFDDQDIHTEPASAVVPAATVPYRDGDNPKE